MRRLWILTATVFAISGCGRYFPTALQPAAGQAEGMTANDDGSITYELDRLAITLRPMTDAELNRQFASESFRGASSVNPYTFGDWSTPGEDWTPPRFTVFRLEVGNYQYPKVMLDPLNASVTTANNRTYGSLSYANLYEYYQAYFQGRTGRARAEFRTRTDLLKRTMYRAALVFSGMDGEGYLVFPLLHDDVRRIVVHIEDVALRFNYADLPVETVDLSFSFERDMRQGYIPMDAIIRN